MGSHLECVRPFSTWATDDPACTLLKLKLTGCHKPTPWDRESFEVPWPDAIPKAIVIELGMYIFLWYNDLLKILCSLPVNIRWVKSLISFERFASTLEEFTTKLVKMFEASLQYIWQVVSINQSPSITVLKSFWPAAFSRQGHGESRFEPGISFSYHPTRSQTRRDIENSSLRSGGWIDHKWHCRWCTSKTGEIGKRLADFISSNSAERDLWRGD